MVDVERALQESLELYKKNPVLILPHLAETILTFGTIITLAITVFMVVQVKLGETAFEDPELFLEAATGAGPGFLALIILTVLVATLALAVVKAGAFAGVVGMAKKGFNGEKITTGAAMDSAKKHSLDILLFWLLLAIGLGSLLLISLIPTVLMALLGLPEVLGVLATFITLSLTFIIWLLLYIALLFTPQFIVASESGVRDALTKSIGFVKDNKGAVAIYLVVAIAFNLFLYATIWILSIIPGAIAGENPFIGSAAGIFINLLIMALSLLAAPFFEIVKTRMIIEQSSLLI